MTEQLIEQITWFDNPHFLSTVTLGKEARQYQFKADWNSRNDSWFISLLYGNTPLLLAVRLIIGVNLLSYCYYENRPECMLIALTSNNNITRAGYDEMTSGMVKLYQIVKTEEA